MTPEKKKKKKKKKIDYLFQARICECIVVLVVSCDIQWTLYTVKRIRKNHHNGLLAVCLV